MFDIWVLAALGGVAVLAGFVDAVAGGGGLITIPALLAAGVPPVAALATNKAQGVVGTSIAAFTYWRKGYVSIAALLPAILATFAGSFLGAMIVKSVDTAMLETLIPIAVIAVAIYFAISPSIRDVDGKARLDFARWVPVFGFIIGFYDGIFGPGTGSFFLMAFVALFGLSAARGSANTKVLNVTSNLAAIAFFVFADAIVWPVVLVMAAGQIVGGYLGAVVGMRYGAKVIRPLVIVVSMAMAIKLLVFP